MQKLTKSQFMSKVINDRYEKKRKEKDSLKSADIHTFQNINKVKRRNNK